MATSGTNRIFISVSSVADSLAYYRDWMGLRVVAEGDLEPTEVQGLYGLPKGTRARAVLLKGDIRDTMLELIEFQPNSGKPIRGKETTAADPGFYCMVVLVRDIEKVYRDLTQKGFSFLSPPQPYRTERFPFDVIEVTVIGPDHTLTDFAQRVNTREYTAQEVVLFEDLTDAIQASRNNCVRIDHVGVNCEDIEETIRFYNGTLGIDVRGYTFGGTQSIPPGVVDELLGVPYGTEYRVNFIRRMGTNTTGFEALQVGIPGKPVTQVGRPPDLGLFMLSFQVDDLAAMLANCREQGFEVLAGPVELKGELQGEARAAVVSDPNGIMVELFER